MVLAVASVASAPSHFLPLLTVTNCAGIAGIGLGASWALLARRSTILVCQTIGGLSFALHFFLLGSLAGALMCVAASLQSSVARLGLGRAALLACYGATLGAAAAIAFATSAGVAPLCATIGLVFATIGRMQDDTQRMRLAFLACSCAWAVHNFLVGSVIGNVSDVLTVTGIVAGLWAHRRRERRAAEAGGAAPVPARL
jgi:hypothetical protein